MFPHQRTAVCSAARCRPTRVPPAPSAKPNRVALVGQRTPSAPIRPRNRHRPARPLESRRPQDPLQPNASATYEIQGPAVATAASAAAAAAAAAAASPVASQVQLDCLNCCCSQYGHPCWPCYHQRKQVAVSVQLVRLAERCLPSLPALHHRCLGSQHSALCRMQHRRCRTTRCWGLRHSAVWRKGRRRHCRSLAFRGLQADYATHLHGCL
mmetsp:Transcript_10852/g.38068  ORF Transcript_10852/g.38068 Transcript_10852/m.38068 type:complete len:211 (-) Transcript_10852:2054-2686(-)